MAEGVPFLQSSSHDYHILTTRKNTVPLLLPLLLPLLQLIHSCKRKKEEILYVMIFYMRRVKSGFADATPNQVALLSSE